MDYETVKSFSDSWGLVYLVVMFVAACAYAFRPGSKKAAERAALLPLKED